jgi:hypothetical protein
MSTSPISPETGLPEQVEVASYVNNPVRILIISLAEELSTKESPIYSQDIDRVIHSDFKGIYTHYLAGRSAIASCQDALEWLGAHAEALTCLARAIGNPESQARLLAWLAGANFQVHGKRP